MVVAGRFKAAVVLLAVAMSVTACAEDAAPVNKGTESEPAPNTVDTPLNDIVERITIDGMPCLIWKDKAGSGNTTYAYSGLTCDWSKNKGGN